MDGLLNCTHLIIFVYAMILTLFFTVGNTSRALVEKTNLLIAATYKWNRTAVPLKSHKRDPTQGAEHRN